MSSQDFLNLATDKKALKALAANSAGNDVVLLSLELTKINRKGKSQKRVLLITNRHLLNLMPHNYSKCNRCMMLNKVHHVTTSSAVQEFVIHLTDEYDYHFKTPLFEQVVASVSKAYKNATGSDLDVKDCSVDELARQVITKVAVKQMGSSWGPTQPSTKEEGVMEDDADSDGDDGLGAASTKEDAAAVGSDVVGGAFKAKSKYTFDDFELIKVLGKGAFGKVMLVKAKESGQIYAMKALSKQLLLERNEIVHTKTERRALEDTHHPFLVHLRFAFQSATKLYLVMDYCNGGELFYHLKTSGRFSESRARLYAAEICSAIHHLHELCIIYRDLKPENVLLDHEGHVRITDFGLAKDAMELGDRTHTFCGTPDYLAPEVIKGSGHGRGVDWWSLGTMIYEMLDGLPPFYSENQNVMYTRILQEQLRFRERDGRPVFSETARDLCTKMLQKAPEARLGSSERDGHELREHAWFASIDWVKLERRELVPEFKPSLAGELDTSNFDEEFTSQAVAESVVPDHMLAPGGKPTVTNFDDFTYVDKGHLK